MTRHFYAIYRPYADCNSEGDLIFSFPNARARDEFCSRKGLHWQAINAADVRRLFRPLYHFESCCYVGDTFRCDALPYSAEPTHIRR